MIVTDILKQLSRDFDEEEMGSVVMIIIYKNALPRYLIQVLFCIIIL